MDGLTLGVGASVVNAVGDLGEGDLKKRAVRGAEGANGITQLQVPGRSEIRANDSVEGPISLSFKNQDWQGATFALMSNGNHAYCKEAAENDAQMPEVCQVLDALCLA